MAGADAEPAAAPAKQAPELSKLFPGKKKGFKATNFSGGGTKEAPKKKAAAGEDEWDEEKLGNEKLKVAVQVEALNVGEEVETEKPTWNVGKATEAGEEKATKQYPSLAGSVKPGAEKASSAGPAAPAKVEGIRGDRSKFDVLTREEEPDDDAPQEAGGKDKEEVNAKKAEKKEAKRLEKERREQEEAAAKVQKEKKARVVLVDGVPDTQIKADVDRIMAKYDGRRKRPMLPIDED